jgi:hypothetical protein
LLERFLQSVGNFCAHRTHRLFGSGSQPLVKHRGDARSHFDGLNLMDHLKIASIAAASCGLWGVISAIRPVPAVAG